MMIGHLLIIHILRSPFTNKPERGDFEEVVEFNTHLLNDRIFTLIQQIEVDKNNAIPAVCESLKHFFNDTRF